MHGTMAWPAHSHSLSPSHFPIPIPIPIPTRCPRLPPASRAKGQRSASRHGLPCPALFSAFCPTSATLVTSSPVQSSPVPGLLALPLAHMRALSVPPFPPFFPPAPFPRVHPSSRPHLPLLEARCSLLFPLRSVPSVLCVAFSASVLCSPLGVVRVVFRSVPRGVPDRQIGHILIATVSTDLLCPSCLTWTERFGSRRTTFSPSVHSPGHSFSRIGRVSALQQGHRHTFGHSGLSPRRRN